ncbi:hypothetical protein FRC14_007001, partial [Serendipita sp. 396]
MATTIQDGSPSTHTTNGPTNRKAQMRVEIPKNREPSETDAIRTPKTPQNEGISWFESSHVGSQPVQVYELKLESDGGPNKNRAYTRLPPPASPYILRLSLDAGTPASKRGVLKTNFPLYGGAFERTKFVEKTLPSDFSKPVQIDLPISSAGVFVYWIEYDGKDGERVKGREGYFNIDPDLRVRKRTPILTPEQTVHAPGKGGLITEKTTHIPLDGLSIITLVSKWMGRLDEWTPYLKETSERGYNMIHYTPLQQRGQSMSPYSIADQLAFDRELFPTGWTGSRDDGTLQMLKTLKKARDEFGLMSLVDIVLNHTADNTVWLADHPEAGFSPLNMPHLTPALELDDAIIEFSGSLDANGLPTIIKSQDDVDLLVSSLREYLNTRNLWQYYVLDVTGEKKAIGEALTSGKIPSWDGPDLCVANNGWIWGADPLANFAAHPSKAYLRREVIVWEDCVKLNYGNGPEDNPWLWKHMTEYVTLLAGMFDGFRIDNCHSTPLHVGCALLDAARVVNPDLYICAELFTGSEETDITFVSRLGITSLIREGYNAWDPKEMSRILYRFGVQKPIGSMDGACMTSPADIPPPTGKGPTRAGLVSPLQGSVPHAVFFDLTHDNESPLHKRSAEDALSTGALVAFSHCAVGSVKGFDDLYPRLLSLGSENRRYDVSENSGIGQVKRILNNLHTEMALEGFGEAHVHQENDYIVIHRVEPKSQRGYLVVVHTAFQKGSKDRGHIKPIQLRRTKAKFIYGASLDIHSYEDVNDPKLLKGLDSTLCLLPPVEGRNGADNDGPYQEIIVPDSFPPGSIMLFSTKLEELPPNIDQFCKED